MTAEAIESNKNDGTSRTVIRRVFVDFGLGKVYCLADGGDKVTEFTDLKQVVERLKPDEVVADSYPRRCLETMRELMKEGVKFLRLVDLNLLTSHRKLNGIEKSDENDVKILREIFEARPESFRELEMDRVLLMLLTEQWGIFNDLRKKVKQVSIENIADETYKELSNTVKRLSRRVVKEADKLPLYRKIVEETGIRGPSLAYIVAHHYDDLLTLPRDKLVTKFQLIKRNHKRRRKSSQILIKLAWSISQKNNKYKAVYRHYYEKFKGYRHRKWKAILRVAHKLLRDINHVSKTYKNTA